MTNKHIELPALPAPIARLYRDACGQKRWDSNACLGGDIAVFSAAYMHAYALAAIAAHEQVRVVGEPAAWLRYEPTVMVEESRGRTTATGAAMEPNAEGRWVRLRDVLASPPAPQEAQAVPPGFALVSVEQLTHWKQRVNTLASLSLKAERHEVGGCLKTEIADVIADPLNIAEDLAAPVAQPATEQAEAPSDADPLTPEQEEWVMDLAEKHNLGRRVPQIGAMRGVAPDVFYTDASYRTHELFCFAAALLSTKEQS